MPNLTHIVLRKPLLTDGMDVFNLVAQCAPLDVNSCYCNMLQCSHFASTSVAALIDEQLLGFVSGYITPNQPDILFIWQVAVSPKARGVGLASRMIEHILSRDNCQHIRYLHTTITQSNLASWNLFNRIARQHEVPLTSSPWLDQTQHFMGQHDSEALVQIGPLF